MFLRLRRSGPLPFFIDPSDQHSRNDETQAHCQNNMSAVMPFEMISLSSTEVVGEAPAICTRPLAIRPTGRIISIASRALQVWRALRPTILRGSTISSNCSSSM